MEISFKVADQFFTKHSNQFSPIFDPRYVVADSKRSSALKPKFFLYEEGSLWWFHGFHVVGDVAKSPYCYGGPIALDNVGYTDNTKKFLINAYDAYMSWGDKNGIKSHSIQFHPMAENHRLWSGEVFKKSETVFMDVERETTSTLSTFEKRTRNAIHNAQRHGVTVKAHYGIESVMEFREFYLENLKSITTDKFYQFNKQYFEAMSELGSVWSAYYDDELIASAFFLVSNYQADYHLSASTAEGKRLNAMSLIISQFAYWCADSGIKFIYLGGGKGGSDDSLFKFKSGFSSQRAVLYTGKA